MGIPLGSNFDLVASLPLDSRVVVVDLAARDLLDPVARYEGLAIYVLSEAKEYRLQGGIDNTDWVELAGGGDVLTYKVVTDTWQAPVTLDGQTQDLGQELFIPSIDPTLPVMVAGEMKVFLGVGVSPTDPDFADVIQPTAGQLSNESVFGVNTTIPDPITGKFKMTTYGFLSNVDTSLWAVNTTLWVDPVIPGGLTQVKPIQDAYAVALVAVQDALIGKVFVLTGRSQTDAGSLVPGIFEQIWLTGELSAVTPFYETRVEDKGTVAEVTQSIICPDNTKNPIPIDHISIPFTIPATVNKGTYEAVIELTNSSTSANERLYMEIYLTDGAGVPEDPLIPGQPVGDLGVPPLAFLESAVMNLASTITQFVSLNGLVTSSVVIPVGKRIRYHILAEKIGTQGGDKTFVIYFGSDNATFVKAPVAIGLDDLYDVDVSTAITGHVLTKNSSGIWVGTIVGSDVGGYVDLTTDQSIAGVKTFNTKSVFVNGLDVRDGAAVVTGNIYGGGASFTISSVVANLFLRPSSISGAIGLGSHIKPATFLQVKDTNSTPHVTIMDVEDDANLTLFSIKQAGSIYMPKLGPKTTETEVVYFDPGTGLLTHGLSAAGGLIWGVLSGEHGLVFGTFGSPTVNSEGGKISYNTTGNVLTIGSSAELTASIFLKQGTTYASAEFVASDTSLRIFSSRPALTLAVNAGGKVTIGNHVPTDVFFNVQNPQTTGFLAAIFQVETITVNDHVFRVNNDGSILMKKLASATASDVIFFDPGSGLLTHGLAPAGSVSPWDTTTDPPNISYIAGNVGIGIQSPGALLTVARHSAEGTVPPVIRLHDIDGSLIANNINGKIEFYSADASGGGAGVDTAIYGIRDAEFPNGDAGALTIWTGKVSDFTEKMRITWDGKVGIGVTAPASSPGFGKILEIGGGTDASLKLNGTTGAWEIGVNASGHMQFYSGGTLRMWLPISGSDVLIVDAGGGSGGIYLDTAATGQAHIVFGATGGQGRGKSGIYYSDNADQIFFQTGGTDSLVIHTDGKIRFNLYGGGGITGTGTYALAVDSGGNIIEIPIGGGSSPWDTTTQPPDISYIAGLVGIGTATPTGSSPGIALNVTVEGSDESFPTIRLERTAGGTKTPAAYEQVIGSDGTWFLREVGANDPILIKQGAPGLSLVLAPDGVGIGTSTPSEKLEVAGNIVIGVDETYNLLRTSAAGGAIRFGTSSTTTNRDLQLGFVDNAASFLTVMTIANSSNMIAIGTGIPYRTLTVNGIGSFVSGGTSGSLGVEIGEVLSVLPTGSKTQGMIATLDSAVGTSGSLLIQPRVGVSANMQLWTEGASRLTINSSGSLIFNLYGTGAVTGTLAYSLGVDASGNVIEYVAGGGGSQWVDVTGGIYYTAGVLGFGDSAPVAPISIQNSAQPTGGVGSYVNFKTEKYRAMNNNFTRTLSGYQHTSSSGWADWDLYEWIDIDGGWSTPQTALIWHRQYPHGGIYQWGSAATALFAIGEGFGSPYVSVYPLGNGTSTVPVYVDLNGKLLNTSSDARLKDNIRPFDRDALTILRGFSPKMFEYKEYGNLEIGWVAQEAIELIPEMFPMDKNDKYYNLNERLMLPHLHKAVIQVDDKVALLEREVKKLKEELHILKN